MKPLERIILEIKSYDHELVTGTLESGINQYVVHESSIADKIRNLCHHWQSSCSLEQSVGAPLL